MKGAFAGLLLASFSLPLAAQPTLRREVTWDANLEGGLGTLYRSPHETLRFLRGSGGVLFVADPRFYALDLSYELANVSKTTIALEASTAHIESGLWARAAGKLDVDGMHPGAALSVGLSILGVEAQYRSWDRTGAAWSLAALVRVPIGLIGFGLRRGR